MNLSAYAHGCSFGKASRQEGRKAGIELKWPFVNLILKCLMLREGKNPVRTSLNVRKQLPANLCHRMCQADCGLSVLSHGALECLYVPFGMSRYVFVLSVSLLLYDNRHNEESAYP